MNEVIGSGGVITVTDGTGWTAIDASKLVFEDSDYYKITTDGTGPSTVYFECRSWFSPQPIQKKTKLEKLVEDILDDL